MRKVLIWDCGKGGYSIPGKFHEWGIYSEVIDKGIKTDTVAIVEFENGSIGSIPPSQVKFLNMANRLEFNNIKEENAG